MERSNSDQQNLWQLGHNKSMVVKRTITWLFTSSYVALHGSDRGLLQVLFHYIEFVEPSKRHADVIIPEGGHNKIALDMVISRVVRNPNWLLCCMYVCM